MSDPTIESWHERAEAYAALLERWPLFTTVADRLVASLPADFDGRLVDMGAGTGLVSKRVRARYPRARLVMLEPAEGMRRLARERLPDAEVHALRAEEVGSLDGVADAVLSSAVMQLCEVPEVLAGVARILVPEGIFAFQLWWHSFDELAGFDPDPLWHGAVDAALENRGHPRAEWPARPARRMRTRAQLEADGRAVGLTLEDVAIDRDRDSLSFYVDFAAMSASFLGHLEKDEREAVLDEARAALTDTCEVPSARFLFRRLAQPG